MQSVISSKIVDPKISQNVQKDFPDSNESYVLSSLFINEPCAQMCPDISSYLTGKSELIDKYRSYEKDIPSRMKYDTGSSDPLDRVVLHFYAAASCLDYNNFIKAIKKDFVFGTIFEILKTQSSYHHNNITYRLHRGIMIASEDKEGIIQHKICIPSVVAYSFVSLVHLHENHVRLPKLMNIINIRFKISGLKLICQETIKNCFFCSLTRTPIISSRPHLPKHPQLIREKGRFWHVDVLTLCAPRDGIINKVFTAVCLFSNFLVVKPVSEVTSESFLDFLITDITAIFTTPVVITTDNERSLNSDLVKKCLNVIGVYKANTSPYTPRSMQAELLNKLLLGHLRNASISSAMNITQMAKFLGPIVSIINSQPFSRHPFLSPYLIMFSQLPRQWLYQFYEGEKTIFTSKEAYLAHIIEINSLLTCVRAMMISKRDYPDQGKRQRSHSDGIKPGCIVSVKSPSRQNRLADHKLRPVFRDRFIVVSRTDTSCFLTPCLENNINDFIKPLQLFEKQKDRILYKCDIENLTLIRDTSILVSNSFTSYYEKFLTQNFLPTDLYFSSCPNNDHEAYIQTLKELTGELSERLDDEYQEIDLSLRSLTSKPPVSPSIRTLRSPTSLQSEIRSISKILSQHKKTNVKCVQFKETVTVHPMIKSNRIYFCLKSRTTPLQRSVNLPSRSINGGQYFCTCNPCRIQLTLCEMQPCSLCVPTQSLPSV